MNIPKPAALLLVLAALAWFKPWETQRPTPDAATPWITPYSQPADPSALAAIRTEARKSPVAASALAGMYQIFGDMIEADATRGKVIQSGADVRQAAEMALKLNSYQPVKLPMGLFNQGGNVGLIDQYVRKQAGDSPAALTPESRAKFARAYRDVAWALEQES